MWFKVDDKFLRHHKTLAAAQSLGGPKQLGRVAAVWLEAGLWVSENLTDGYVPSIAVDLFRTDAKPHEVMRACVTGGLLSSCDNGYRFHQWDHYNPSADAVKDKRERDRQRKKNGGRAPRAIPTGAINASLPFLDGIVVETVAIPPRLQLESSASRARDPVPVPVSQDPDQEQRALARRPPLRVADKATRRILIAATHKLLDVAPQFLDAQGNLTDIAELTEQLKEIASRHLNATWNHSRELQIVIDAAVARRKKLRSNGPIREYWQRRETALMRRRVR
jgi:hypothetical protein